MRWRSLFTSASSSVAIAGGAACLSTLGVLTSAADSKDKQPILLLDDEIHGPKKLTASALSSGHASSSSHELDESTAKLVLVQVVFR